MTHSDELSASAAEALKGALNFFDGDIHITTSALCYYFIF